MTRHMNNRFVLLLSFLVVLSPFVSAQHTYPGSLSAPNQTTPVPDAKPTTVATPVAATGAATSSGRKLSYELNVSGDRPWTDTAIEVAAGDRVTISSEGALNFATDNIAAKATPDGLPRSWREVITALPVNAAGIGALIGRVGNADVEVPFLVGTRKEIAVPRTGKLFLGVNEPVDQTGQGAYKVRVQIVPAAATAPRAAAPPLQLPADLFDRVPRRIADKNGNAGDMVNFVMVGPEESMQRAFTDAGWVQVDKTKAEAAIHAVLSTYSKKAYTEMPMSELYLYGRPQDFGFARAEPVQVVQSRHHLRVWKAPFDIDGQPVWVGAATHDIGFEHDNRGQGVLAITHKIDPDIDQEREFVAQTLNATGDVTRISKMTPSDPLKDARTATGGTFHSDGQVLLIQLNQ
jgi:hypothetical protein